MGGGREREGWGRAIIRRHSRGHRRKLLEGCRGRGRARGYLDGGNRDPLVTARGGRTVRIRRLGRERGCHGRSQ